MKLDNIFYKQDFEDLKRAGFEPFGRSGLIFSQTELKDIKYLERQIKLALKAANNNGLDYKNCVVNILRDEERRTKRTRQYFYLVTALRETTKTL